MNCCNIDGQKVKCFNKVNNRWCFFCCFYDGNNIFNYFLTMKYIFKDGPKERTL